MLDNSAEVRLRAIRQRFHRLMVLGFIPNSSPRSPPSTFPTQSLQPVHSLPIGPGTSPPLISVTLSQETLRLSIITFPAHCVGLVIRAGNNRSCPFLPSFFLFLSLSLPLPPRSLPPSLDENTYHLVIYHAKQGHVCVVSRRTPSLFPLSCLQPAEAAAAYECISVE